MSHAEPTTADIDDPRAPSEDLHALPALRARRAAVWVGLGLFTAWCPWSFDASPARIRTGLGRLGTVASFMVPPHV